MYGTREWDAADGGEGTEAACPVAPTLFKADEFPYTPFDVEEEEDKWWELDKCEFDAYESYNTQCIIHHELNQMMMRERKVRALGVEERGRDIQKYLSMPGR